MNRFLVKMLCLFLCPLNLMSCDDDDAREDRVTTVKMYVSSETSTYTPWGSDEAVECMLVMEEGEEEYKHLAFEGIEGFTYERGCRYQLRVEKTLLANPPADSSNVRYRLIEVEQQEAAFPEAEEAVSSARRAACAGSE